MDGIMVSLIYKTIHWHLIRSVVSVGMNSAAGMGTTLPKIWTLVTTYTRVLICAEVVKLLENVVTSSS